MSNTFLNIVKVQKFLIEFIDVGGLSHVILLTNCQMVKSQKIITGSFWHSVQRQTEVSGSLFIPLVNESREDLTVAH